MKKLLSLILLITLTTGLISSCNENNDVSNQSEYYSSNGSLSISESNLVSSDASTLMESSENSGYVSNNSEDENGGGDFFGDGKHIATWAGMYPPFMYNFVGVKDEFRDIFGYTIDYNLGGFCDYYNISKQEYIEYWEIFKKHLKETATVEIYKLIMDEMAFIFEYDAWFSELPEDQEVFLVDNYKFTDIRSICCRPEGEYEYTNRYYTIDSALISFIGKDKFNEFYNKYEGTTEFNILNFVDYFKIDEKTYNDILEKQDYGDANSIIYPYDPKYLYGTTEMKEKYFKRNDKNKLKYYTIDHRLILYIRNKGLEKQYMEFCDSIIWQDYNIVNFIQKFNIDKETYISIIESFKIGDKAIYPYDPEFLYAEPEVRDAYFKQKN